ncbi:carboxymuconolactone decarboxylase family protein [Allorhodopirellula solitaria]|uniref:Carboxymuconolactone decarboxylase family protein n=1 Tax=Allorhodopirellula solitaria TaxID=2527987 RepID=A0A5C5X0P6_9BACT|nr:carboxymuconolactone decarboxylase family protein [Allorhodopirellula solitaria]TWT55733.1 Carboxymuconolactone decarboxylase family protein [Allorhodopirellula solitaria]
MIPKSYEKMHEDFPEFMQAYEAMGKASRESGPLSDREVALVKLAISITAGLEGGAHSHTRKALQAGCSGEDLRHVALLTAPTIGFPTMMRAKSWVEDVLDKQ